MYVCIYIYIYVLLYTLITLHIIIAIHINACEPQVRAARPEGHGIWRFGDFASAAPALPGREVPPPLTMYGFQGFPTIFEVFTVF